MSILNRILKTIVLGVVLIFNSILVSGQTQREVLLSEIFDTLLYYDDSTIAMAGHLYKNKLSGYAVEFDHKFRPLWIGEYRDGWKVGTWNSALGSWEDYYQGGTGGTVSANHSIKDSIQNSFFKQYAKLTGLYTSQHHEHILKNKFDSILFFGDSVIREVAMMKDHHMHGTAIAFDSLGNPSEIGEYERGKRTGSWMEIKGCERKYDAGEISSGDCTGCGYAWNKFRREFYIQYKELTGIDLLFVLDF